MSGGKQQPPEQARNSTPFAQKESEPPTTQGFRRSSEFQMFLKKGIAVEIKSQK